MLICLGNGTIGDVFNLMGGELSPTPLAYKCDAKDYTAITFYDDKGIITLPNEPFVYDGIVYLIPDNIQYQPDNAHYTIRMDKYIQNERQRLMYGINTTSLENTDILISSIIDLYEMCYEILGEIQRLHPTPSEVVQNG